MGRDGCALTHEAIAKVLYAADDGLTVTQIAKELDRSTKYVRHSLKTMRDTYIDRWRYTGSQPEAVWCIADVPEDCPKPDRKWRVKGKQ